MTEDCLCGSGRPMQECCYEKYPSISYTRESAASVDFYTRWAVNRHMLWRVICEYLGPPARPPLRSLVVLGAGSCRDLPMDYLCANFHEVVLVDKNSPSTTPFSVRWPWTSRCARCTTGRGAR